MLACKDLKLPLDVIGPGPDAALDRLRRLGGPLLKVHGFLDDKTVQSYVGQCRALIHAATEDFGLAPVEAMSAGKPVIGYRFSGLADTVIDADPKRTGLLFDDPSTEGLIKALTRFMDLEPQIRREDCRDQAGKFTRERFDREFSELVERVLAEDG